MHTCRKMGALASRQTKELVDWGVPEGEQWGRRKVMAKCGKGPEGRREGGKRGWCGQQAGHIPCVTGGRLGQAWMLSIRLMEGCGPPSWLFLLFIHSCMYAFIHSPDSYSSNYEV